MNPSPNTTLSKPAARHNIAVIALARIYLKLGLPFPAALKAAIADYAAFNTDAAFVAQPLCAA